MSRMSPVLRRRRLLHRVVDVSGPAADDHDRSSTDPLVFRAATRDHSSPTRSKTAGSTGRSRAGPAYSPTVHTRAATTQDRSPQRQTTASLAPTSPPLPPITQRFVHRTPLVSQ
jgi:hypothetical protein